MPPAEPVAADSSPTDAALIAAWQGGDEQAATELVRRHARALARFLAGAGAPEADLDDVVQETFIRAFRAVATFRGQCRFRTWLLTIGGNVLKDAHRRAKRSRVVPLGDDLRSTDGDPHERAVAAEAEGRLGEGLQQEARGPARPSVWSQPAWLKIAAALVVVAGAGVVARGVWPARPGAGAPVETVDLSDMSAPQLRELLRSVEQPGAPEPVSSQDVGLEDLSPAQLRALLASLETET